MNVNDYREEQHWRQQEEEQEEQEEQQQQQRPRWQTQPIHKSILARRKRTVVRASSETISKTVRNDSFKKDSKIDSKDVHRLRSMASRPGGSNAQIQPASSNPQTSQTSPTSPTSPLSSRTRANPNDHDNPIDNPIDNNQGNNNNNSGGTSWSPKSPPSPMLTSPFWVRISERWDDVLDFVPESRRAASSALFVPSWNDDSSRQTTETTSSSPLGHGRLVVDPLDDSATSENDKLTSQNNETEEIQRNHTSHDASTDMIDDSAANYLPHQDINDDASSSEPSPSSSSSNNDSSSNEQQEYMILSGGYTDRDWKTFPVYGFPISSSIRTGSGRWIDLSPSPDDLLDIVDQSVCEEDRDIARDRFYREATFLMDGDGNVTQVNDSGTSHDDETSNKVNSVNDLWKQADPCPPPGRMGHSSVIYKNKLYVFGGLIYDNEENKKESFRLEDIPYVYRLDLEEMFRLRRWEGWNENDAEQSHHAAAAAAATTNKKNDVVNNGHHHQRIRILNDDNPTDDTHTTPKPKIIGWQRIIPHVKPLATPNVLPTTTNNPPPSSSSSSSSSPAAAEILLKSVNRGEMQGGLWNPPPNARRVHKQHDQFVMYGGLRIATLEYEGYGSLDTTIHSKDGKRMKSHRVVELPLGDAWSYDLELDAWERITNDYGWGVPFSDDPNDNSQNDSNDNSDNDSNGNSNNDSQNDSDNESKPNKETTSNHDVSPPNQPTDNNNNNNNDDDDGWFAFLDASLFPRPRTAHAATIVRNELIIHGGMGMTGTNDWDGSTEWETLDDMWVLDLTTRKWKRRWLFPLLVRSYHSLVGWRVEEKVKGWGEGVDGLEGPVMAAFGGYTTGMDVFTGEEIAYVFDDLLISYPPPINSNDLTPTSPWLKANFPENRDGAESISNRFEHSAVLSQRFGTMHVWGGQFEDTSNVKGMWLINVAGEDSRVNFMMAEADGIYDDYEATLTALHTIVIMMMFMSMSLTLLLGLTQRYNELLQQAANDEATAGTFHAQDFGTESPPVRRRGRGLHPEIIDTLPQKLYSRGDGVTEHATSTSDNAAAEEDKNDCCPICLVDYEEGDELRVLPCDHYMHKSCVDAWLGNNPSCPSCRYSLSELVDDRPMLQLGTLRSRLTSSSSAVARLLTSQDAFFLPSIQLQYARDEGPENNEIEMTTDFGEGSSSRRTTVIDLRYVSSLVLTEEDAENSTAANTGVTTTNPEATSSTTTTTTTVSTSRRPTGNDATQATTQESSRRGRRSHGDRSHRLAGFRHNVARIRRGRRRTRDASTIVPLTNSMDGENGAALV